VKTRYSEVMGSPLNRGSYIESFEFHYERLETLGEQVSYLFKLSRCSSFFAECIHRLSSIARPLTAPACFVRICAVHVLYWNVRHHSKKHVTSPPRLTVAKAASIASEQHKLSWENKRWPTATREKAKNDVGNRVYP
jgi:hypothetical protein